MRCQCVLSTVLMQTMAQAAVPAVCIGQDLATVRAHSGMPKGFQLPVSPQQQSTLWVRCPRAHWRRPWVVSLFPMVYLARGLGSAHVVSTAGLIDGQFIQGQKPIQQAICAHTRCLVIEVPAHNHRMLPDLVLDLISVRSRVAGLTVWVTDEDISQYPGRYGTGVAQHFQDARRYGWQIVDIQ